MCLQHKLRMYSEGQYNNADIPLQKSTILVHQSIFLLNYCTIPIRIYAATAK